MNQTVEAIVTIALAIAGIAMIAVLVSGRAQTANVISAGGGAFSQSLLAAEAPVTGAGGADWPGMSTYF